MAFKAAEDNVFVLMEDLYITRINDLDRGNDTSKSRVGSPHGDLVIRPNVTKWPEECVTMCRDADISGGPR